MEYLYCMFKNDRSFSISFCVSQFPNDNLNLVYSLKPGKSIINLKFSWSWVAFIQARILVHIKCDLRVGHSYLEESRSVKVLYYSEKKLRR